MEVEMQVVDASYTMEKDLAVVELFGRTREGKSVAVRYEKFRPYFYILKKEKNDLLPTLKQELRSEIISIESVPLTYGGEKREFYKITIKTPEKVKKIRDRFQSRTTFASSDIIYALKFYYDLDLSLCIRIEGEQIEHEGYHTDIIMNATKIEPIPRAFTVPLTYLSFDIECSISNKTLLTLSAIVKKGEDWIERIFVGGEEYIIREFERFVKESDPDIITGWNIDNYDITQLMNRAEDKGVAHPHLSRNIHTLRRHSRFWRATGRVIADAWWHTKLIEHPKKETLGAVAREMLNKDKTEEIIGKKIDEHWAKERENVMRYCLNDARLAMEILLKVRAVDKGFNMGAVSNLPLNQAMENRTSQFIDSLLIRVADREGYAVPCTKEDEGKDKTEGIEGAYVHEIKSGLRKWIVSVDFKSLYPSIIIANNLCFSTFEPKNGTILTPAGAKFLDPSIRRGIIPRMMEKLLADRAAIKKLMKDNPEQENFYDGLQYAVKVLANAFYGVMSSAFYRFTNPSIGASITAYGRELIKGIIEKLEGRGIEVIYADTDGIFMQSPYNNLDQTVEFGRNISTEFSHGGYILEFDKVFESFFSHGAKKRYVGKVAWPKSTLFVRGYEIRRTDAFNLQSKTLEHVFNSVLENKPDEAISYTKGIIDALKEGNVSISELVISKTCKGFMTYKYPDRMPNVQAARKMIEAKYPFTSGSKVSWIVTDANNTPMEVEPYLDGVPFTKEPDWTYYTERIATTISRVTEAFGWTFNKLLDRTPTKHEKAEIKQAIREGMFIKSKKQRSLSEFGEEDNEQIL